MVENNTGEPVDLVIAAEGLIKENDALLGIAPVNHVASKYEHYINMTEEDMGEMGKEECIHANFILTQYAASVNKHVNWLESKLRINVALFERELVKVYASYNEYWGKDFIIAAACNEYVYLKEMQNEIFKLQAVLSSMEGLLGRVDNMAKCMSNLAYVKRS